MMARIKTLLKSSSSWASCLRSQEHEGVRAGWSWKRFQMRQKTSQSSVGRGCFLWGELFFHENLNCSDCEWHEGVFSSLFKVLKGSLKSRTLSFHRNKVHFSAPAPSEKQPRVIGIYLSISQDCQKKQPKFIPLMEATRRERHFWNNSSMVSFPSPFVFHMMQVFNTNISSYSWNIFHFWPHNSFQSSKISTFVHHSRLPGVLTDYLNE